MGGFLTLGSLPKSVENKTKACNQGKRNRDTASWKKMVDGNLFGYRGRTQCGEIGREGSVGSSQNCRWQGGRPIGDGGRKTGKQGTPDAQG